MPSFSTPPISKERLFADQLGQSHGRALGCVLVKLLPNEQESVTVHELIDIGGMRIIQT